MAKKSYKRILPRYSPLFYTIKYFDADGNFRVFEQHAKPIKRGTFGRFINHVCFDLTQQAGTPFEVNAFYTIRFYDVYAQPRPLETIRERVWAGLDNPENYVDGYPVVHTVNRDITFWIAYGESDVSKIQNYMKSKDLPDDKFFAVDRDFHGVFPSGFLTKRWQLRDFFNRKHWRK